MNDATLIIVLHQALFQGMFFAKNLMLRRKLGQAVRGGNKEANRAVAFFALFIACTLYLSLANPAIGSMPLLPRAIATGLALLLLALNVAVGAASLRDLGDSWRVGVIEEQHTDLVEDGIYRCTRNPYFVSYLLMFAAYTVLLQSLVLFALSIVGFCMVHCMVVREEHHLQSQHGATYLDYKKRVPRYLLL